MFLGFTGFLLGFTGFTEFYQVGKDCNGFHFI